MCLFMGNGYPLKGYSSLIFFSSVLKIGPLKGKRLLTIGADLLPVVANSFLLV